MTKIFHCITIGLTVAGTSIAAALQDGHITAIEFVTGTIAVAVSVFGYLADPNGTPPAGPPTAS